LAKSEVSTKGTTAITGHIGLSPAEKKYMTGFSETMDTTNIFAKSILVNGSLYTADMQAPTPSNLKMAIGDMEKAYVDASSRSNPNFVNVGEGNISDLLLIPGLYKWGTGVKIDSDITLIGNESDVWIFQISGDLTIEKDVSITLNGGILPKNIFWQVAGQTTIGSNSDFKGILLCRTQIILKSEAIVNGRLLAETAITLDTNIVTKPML